MVLAGSFVVVSNKGCWGSGGVLFAVSSAGSLESTPMPHNSASTSHAAPLMRWMLLATVGVGVFLITLDNTVLYTALPSIVVDLNATDTEMLWIVNAYPVVVAGLLLSTGTLGDRVGHRRMFVAGLALFGLASALGGVAPSAAVLIIARGLLAVGAAVMMPSTLALIRLTFHDDAELGKAIGIWAFLAVFASAVGPPMGGFLVECFGWGSVFLVNIPFVLVALCATSLVAPRSVLDPEKHWDVASSFLAMLALVCFLLFIKELTHAPQRWILAGLAAVVAVLAALLFIRRQPTLAQPLLAFDLFHNPRFSAGCWGAFLSMIGLVGLQFLITQKVQMVDALSPLASGLLVVSAAVGSGVSSVVAGARAARLGYRLLVSGGLATSFAGAVLVIVAHVATQLWLVGVGLFVVGLGLGAVMAVASTMIITSAPRNRAGMASSVEEVSYEVGSLTAVAVSGSILAGVYGADIRVPAEVLGTAPAEAWSSYRNTVDYASSAALSDMTRQAVMDAARQAYDCGFFVATCAVAAALLGGAWYTNRLLRKK